MRSMGRDVNLEDRLVVQLAGSSLGPVSSLAMSFEQDFNIKYETVSCGTGFKSDQKVGTYFITLVPL